MCSLLVSVMIFYISLLKFKRKLVNNIIIYSEQKVFSWFNEIVSQYSELWKNISYVIKISENEWMNILFMND